MCILFLLNRETGRDSSKNMGVNLTFIADSISWHLLLMPDSNSEDERWAVDSLSCLTRIGCRVAILAGIHEAHIGREFPADLIADAYPGIEVGQPRSRPAPRVILAVEVQLSLRLHHQSLRDPKIVGAFQSSSHVAAVAEVERGRKLEEVGCEPLDTHCAPGSPRSRIQVFPDAHLRIEVAHPRDGPIVQCLMIAIAHRRSLEEALGLQPEPVRIRTDPALTVPAQCASGTTGAVFQLIEQHMLVDSVVPHRRLPGRSPGRLQTSSLGRLRQLRTCNLRDDRFICRCDCGLCTRACYAQRGHQAEDSPRTHRKNKV